jgi:threonine aldolase
MPPPRRGATWFPGDTRRGLSADAEAAMLARRDGAPTDAAAVVARHAAKVQMIDLFSDTKTRPTAAMRQVMAHAEVGDERANEDPSVNRLVERCAALLGKQAALYLPSGTMCNEIALAVHCKPGDEVICDATSHIIGFEGGGPAALAGVMLNPVAGTRGIFSAAQLREKIRADRPYAPRQRLVEVEQTANLGGGAMRQSGIIAAACEYALDHHVARLADDHANARRLAEGIAAIAGLHIDPATVETNLVYFDVTCAGLDAEALCARLLARGVRVGPMGTRTIRAVTHLDVSAADIETAVAALGAAVAG